MKIKYRIDREIPLIQEADVVVVGGGPGGIGAAVMAARQGARTVLVERYGFLGGMAASGEVNPFMPNHVQGRCLDKPVYTDWLAAMQPYLAPAAGPVGEDAIREAAPAARMISKDIAMLAAEDLCLAAGVQLLYHHTLADVSRSGRAVKHLVLHSKSGLAAVRGKVYVDATGDGDLAALAGCAFEMGDSAGHCQPMTLCFKLSHVDVARLPDRSTINRLYDEARARGDVTCSRENVLLFNWLEPDVIHFNTTRILHKSGVSGVELSDAEIEGRRQLRQIVSFLRQRVPGFERARLHSMGHHIGVRETRRIRGLAYLTRAAFEGRARFPDAIARVSYPIDIHNPDGMGTTLLRLKDGEWYEIPYGCLVAQDVDNLLVGGRPISADHAIHSSLRVMPPACSIGQAAGLAAALAAERGCGAAALDGIEVRRRLVQQGAWL